MAITRAQQARQMLKDGNFVMQGGVKNYLGEQETVSDIPVKWQSGPDKPDTELAYITKAEKDLLLKEDIHGSLQDGPNMGPGGIISLDSFGDVGGGGQSGGDYDRDPGGAGSFTGATTPGGMSPADVKLAEARSGTDYDKFRGKTINEIKRVDEKKQGNFFKNLFKARQKGVYNLFPNNPKRELEFLSSLQITNPAKYNSLPQNLKDLLENTQFDFSGTFKDQPKFSFEDFESLTQFDDGAFAQYAKDRGSPGLSVSGDMSKVGLKSVRRDPLTGDPIKDMFGNTLFDYAEPRDGGEGINQIIPIDTTIIQPPSDMNQESETKEEDEGLNLRFRKDGGRINAMKGGIMNTDIIGGAADGNIDEMGRQMYFIGKLVKKATRAVKKIAKSPIGKAALLYTGAGGLGNLAAGQSFFSNFARPGFLGNVGSIFSKGGLENIMAKARLGKFVTSYGDQAPIFEKNILGKALTSPLGIIAGTSLVAGALTAAQEDEAQQIADETGIDIAEIRANPNKYLGRRFRAEGGSIDEPVAKKTMPLLDMGGQEMDLRAEGGFVPIGRMEKADDVPARLSKNEFVFTAEAVRNAGEGDVDKGAEVMYNMMKNLESGGDVSEESQGLDGARKMFQTSQRLEEVL